MSFIFPELIIESIIRDGIANLRANPTIIDSLFSSLTENYNIRKYGSSELDKIKSLIANNQINVIHSIYEASAKEPSFSISLGSDIEARNLTFLGNDAGLIDIPMSMEDYATKAVIVASVIPTSYDSDSGKLDITDASDLTLVYPNQLYIDASNNKFKIISGINNTTGEKSIFIEQEKNVDISASGKIVSTIDYTRNEISEVVLHNYFLQL